VTISRLADSISDTPWRLTQQERQTITCAEAFEDAMACQRTLYLGFFFDGTRNNRLYDEERLAQSNVARLYAAFDDDIQSDEDRQYRYRTYIPGVGTEFWKEIGDAGIGLQNTAGAAAGWGGEARINWALLQVQNNLHRYATGSRLTRESEDRALVRQMSTDIALPELQMTFADDEPDKPGSDADLSLRKDLSVPETLSAIANVQWRGSHIDGRRRVLAQRRALLKGKLAPLLTGRLPRLARIRLSVFGFSRGAAEARVFVNWLRDLCDDASGPLRICGVPVLVDFLGLFDTVASVGVAQAALEDVASGHGGWASPRGLRIPGPQVVARCLHLVAAHEVRGSFLVDAASGSNVEEVVYPGVHSDVGGGYRPGEQGRGLTDSAKLSQIPLCHMYRAALAAGVPLIDLAQAPTPIREQFRVDSALAARFNAYMAQVRGAASGEADTDALVRAHYRAYLRWRRHRLAKQADLPAVKRSSRQDRTDLLEADAELAQEWQYLLDIDQGLRSLQSVRSSLWVRHGYTGLALRAVGGWVASASPAPSITQFIVRKAAGDLKYAQWREVKRTWDDMSPPPAAIAALFEEDVHDSRAWFKPLGKDDDVWEANCRERLRRLMDKQRLATGPARLGPDGRVLARPPRLSLDEQKELDDYLRRLDIHAPTDFPSRALPTQRKGREISTYWGYLRWRTVYQDLLMDFQARYPALAKADRNTLEARQQVLEEENEHLAARAKALHKQESGMLLGGALPDTSALHGIYSRQQEIESELKALDDFLNELGPEPWWKLF